MGEIITKTGFPPAQEQADRCRRAFFADLGEFFGPKPLRGKEISIISLPEKPIKGIM